MSVYYTEKIYTENDMKIKTAKLEAKLAKLTGMVDSLKLTGNENAVNCDLHGEPVAFIPANGECPACKLQAVADVIEAAIIEHAIGGTDNVDRATNLVAKFAYYKREFERLRGDDRNVMLCKEIEAAEQTKGGE